MEKLTVVVLDSSAIIDSGLQALLSHRHHDGVRNLVTVPGVIEEIKDAKTRRKLAFISEDVVRIQSPSQCYVNKVIGFASRLCECNSLSSVDISVIALACELFEQSGGKCRDPPSRIINPVIIRHPRPKQGSAKSTQLPGFYDDHSALLVQAKEDTVSTEDDYSRIADSCLQRLVDLTVAHETNSKAWITPENIDTIGVKRTKPSDGSKVSPNATASTMCLTTDFVMQNVLKQMSVPVIGVDGKMIKAVKRYCRLCTVCERIVGNEDLKCIGCGGGDNVIQKVPVQSKGNGKSVYIYRKNHQQFRRKQRNCSPGPQQHSMKCGRGEKRQKEEGHFRRQTDLLEFDSAGYSGRSRRVM